MEVRFTQPDKMNLIGYFLRDMLRTSLLSDGGLQAAGKLKGRILFRVNSMEVTLVFQQKKIELHQGVAEPIDAHILGDLTDLMRVALGANYLKSLLTGEIKVRGKLF
ncbi:SCP2 sterol-binding domain-containing protein, partial [bacterium]|nr:SCP2 sterol-binding domain-containing protein [bacterium]